MFFVVVGVGREGIVFSVSVEENLPLPDLSLTDQSCVLLLFFGVGREGIVFSMSVEENLPLPDLSLTDWSCVCFYCVKGRALCEREGIV